MTSGINTRLFFEIHSSDMFSFALESMPDEHIFWRMFSLLYRSKGVLAQLVERLNGIEEVTGSNPVGSTLLLLDVERLNRKVSWRIRGTTYVHPRFNSERRRVSSWSCALFPGL